MLPALILGVDNAFRAPAVQLVSVSQALYFERPTAFIMTGLESALVKHVSPPFGPNSNGVCCIQGLPRQPTAWPAKRKAW